MIRSCTVPASVFLVVTWAALSSAADPDKDPTHHLRSLGARFLATGFHAGWSADGKRLVYGNFPAESGLQILEVATRKGRELIDVGKDPSWSWAKDGPIAYVVGSGAEEQVYLVNSDGRNPRKIAHGGSPHWSPDGKTLYVCSPQDGKIRKWDLAKGGDPEDFCEMRRSWYPVVSPDTRQVAFVEQGQFVVVNAVNGEAAFVHKLPGATGGLANWSPDGKWVAFGGYGEEDGIGLWLLDVERNKVTQVDAGPITEPIFSPDGTMLAVDLRANSKRREVWVLETKKLRDLEFVELTTD
jgi:Tol biopolymer transport system component